MKQIEFSWVGTEDSEAGHAIYKCDGVTVLSLSFQRFAEVVARSV